LSAAKRRGEGPPGPVVESQAGKHRVPIVCGGLVKAIKRESNQAGVRHWGVSRQTVTMWRTTLGVPLYTDGMLRLARDWTSERLDDDGRERQLQATLSPERAAKIIEALKGHSGAARQAEVAQGQQGSQGERRDAGQDASGFGPSGMPPARDGRRSGTSCSATRGSCFPDPKPYNTISTSRSRRMTR